TELKAFPAYETNIACPSVVAISSEAHNSPNARCFGVWTVRRKESTSDLGLTLAPATAAMIRATGRSAAGGALPLAAGLPQRPACSGREPAQSITATPRRANLAMALFGSGRGVCIVASLKRCREDGGLRTSCSSPSLPIESERHPSLQRPSAAPGRGAH